MLGIGGADKSRRSDRHPLCAGDACQMQDGATQLRVAISDERDHQPLGIRGPEDPVQTVTRVVSSRRHEARLLDLDTALEGHPEIAGRSTEGHVFDAGERWDNPSDCRLAGADRLSDQLGDVLELAEASLGFDVGVRGQAECELRQ